MTNHIKNSKNNFLLKIKDITNAITITFIIQGVPEVVHHFL